MPVLGPLWWRLVAVVAVLGLASGLVVLVPGTGSATTGDTYVLPPSRYYICRSIRRAWYGTYTTTRVIAPQGAVTRVTAADIFITKSNYDDLNGGGSFYGYDANGQQVSWTNILYDFHLRAGRGLPSPATSCPNERGGRQPVMTITLFGWGSPPIGTLELRRAASGDLTGQIHLLGEARAYPINFRRLKHAGYGS